MEIGISSACFYPEYSTEECIPIMKEMGFNLGEMFFNTSSEYESEFVDRIKKQIEDFNFKINSIHAFCSCFEPFLFDRYPRRREDMLKQFKAVLRTAKELGADCYTFHGMRNIEYKNVDFKFILDIYENLCYTAAEYGIKLAQENVSWCMSSRIDFLYTLREKVKNPLYFTFDIKQAYKVNVDPLRYLEVMSDKLINFHINDRDEKNVCLMPGQGNVNYDKLSNQLKKINYKGNLIIEVYSENYKNKDDFFKAKEYILEKFTSYAK